MHGATEVVTLVGAALAVLVTVAAFVRWAWRLSRKIDRMHRYVEDEMSLNGGSTMRDAIARLEASGDERAAMIARLHEDQRELHRSQDEHATAMEHQMREVFVRLTRLEERGTPGRYRRPSDTGENQVL